MLINDLARRLIEDQKLDITYGTFAEATGYSTFVKEARQKFRDAVHRVLAQQGQESSLANPQWQDLNGWAVRWFLLDASRLRSD